MELRHQFDLAILLGCVKMARSTFYYYSKAARQPDKYEQVKARISKVYHAHKGGLAIAALPCSSNAMEWSLTTRRFLD